jgi:tRNA(Ile2) C34 agmatinyltransferase TiaS
MTRSDSVIQRDVIDILKGVQPKSSKELVALVYAIERLERDFPRDPIIEGNCCHCPVCGNKLKTLGEAYNAVGESRCPDCNQNVSWMNIMFTTNIF